jgi:hypothetical protein
VEKHEKGNLSLVLVKKNEKESNNIKVVYSLADFPAYWSGRHTPHNNVYTILKQ